MNAILTNTITNALHVVFLFFYFIGSLVHYLKKDHTFSFLLVLFFAILLFTKILGVCIHYYNIQETLSPFWIGVAMLFILNNYILSQAMEMPNLWRFIIVFIAVLGSFLFLTLISENNFIYLDMSFLLVYVIVAYYAKSMLRIGFIMVIISNIIWLILRWLANFITGHQITPAYRYDNDIYHLLLIVSTFVIYKAIAKGYWKHSVISPPR